MAMARSIFVGLVVHFLLTAAPTAFGAKDVLSPRWSEQDLADLNADLVAVYRAEFRLRSVTENLTKLLMHERQQQLLGIEEGSVDFRSLHDELQEWWKRHVITPSFRIANNPAASCKVAQLLLLKLLSAERQSQHLGIDTGDMDWGDPDSTIRKALAPVKRRCLQEAFDACMESGNGWHLLSRLAADARQSQLLSMDDSEFEAQAVYLYRRCTVYQLRYHAQTQVAANYTFAWTQDGSVILLSDVDPSEGLGGLLQPHEWRGPRDVDPFDVLQSTTECATRAYGVWTAGAAVALPGAGEDQRRESVVEALLH